MRFLAIIIVLLGFSPLNAEAFGNNAVFFPKSGVAFFDKPFLLHKKPWGLDYQWTVGTAFMQALDYRWWWIAEANFAMGHLNFDKKPFISAFMGGTGIRYNISLNEFRPHAGMLVHYLQFFGDSVDNLPLNLGLPIFAGLKPYFGLEWLIGSEMSLLIDIGYGFYININEPFRQVFYSDIAFVIYF